MKTNKYQLPVLIFGALLVTGFAIWFIISHAPHPSSPQELSPIGQKYYCSMRCEKVIEQCVDTCLRDIARKP